MDSDAASESSLSFDEQLDSCDDNDDSVEKCYFGKSSFELPECFCAEEEVFKEVLSEATWSSVFNSKHGDRLRKLLPSFHEESEIDEVSAQKEINYTLKKLLDGGNFKFGNPIKSFFDRLRDGFLSSEVADVSKSLNNAYYREYKNQQQQYSFHLFRDILISRKKLLDAAYTLPPLQPVKMQQITAKPKDATLSERTRLRYFSTLQDLREEIGETYTSSEDENYPESCPPKVTKKNKNKLHLEASLSPEMAPIVATTAYPPGFPGSGHFLNNCIDMFEVSDERYREMLLTHRERIIQDPDHREYNVSKLEWRDMVLQSGLSKRISSKSIEDLAKKKMKTDNLEWPSFPKVETPSADSEHSSTSLKIYQQEDSAIVEDAEEEPETPIPVSQEYDVLPGLVLMEVKEEAEVTENRLESPHLEASKSPTSFFALLRNLFCDSVEQKLSAPKLEDKVKIFQDTSLATVYDWLNIQESWSDLVSSALKFLAGDLIGILPDTFVPYLDYKEKQQQWQWIGSGRDSEEQLYHLCQQWLDNKDDISLEILETLQGSPPPPRVTTGWTVRPTDEEERKVYREQECVRYQNPHRAFTFKVHGYEAVVGPVKGVYGKESGINKAREHSLLISDRPPFVTILSLVRDSAARLPNGEGTRADICELLKDSQYLSPASDQQIHTVVSGALDRLHYEKDPCVKYDVNRKLWIYLHRNRTEEEFERIHQAQAAAAKARKAVQKTKIIKPKNKDTVRTSAATAITNTECAVAVLNVDVASVANTTTTNSAHSPRSGTSPRTQGSPKQSNFPQSRHIMRSISIPSQLSTKISLAGVDTQTNKKIEMLHNAISSSSNINHMDILDDDLINCPQPTLPSSSPQTQDIHSSRPPSQNSIHALPSPKSVLANVSSSFTPLPIRGVLNVDMKPSSPSFVGQPPVLQPVLNQDMDNASSYNYATTSASTTLLPSPTTTISKSTNTCLPCLQNPKQVASFQTIVIKQEPGLRTVNNLSSLPLLSVEELSSSDPNALTAGSVVASLVQGSQYLSLGNIVANSNAHGTLKDSPGSLQNFKFHGGNICPQMLSTSTINLISSIIEARNAKQETKQEQATGKEPIIVSSSSSMNPLNISGRQFQPVHLKDVSLSSSEALPTSENISKAQIVSTVISNSGMRTVSNTENSLRMSGKDQPLILATKDNLKTLPPAYLMTTPMPTAAVNAAHGVRAATPFNVRTVQGIKVIPVPQSGSGNKNLQNPPMLARIFTPTAGMSLRSTIAADLMQGCQAKPSSSVNIIHGIRTSQQPTNLKRPSIHVSSSQELSNSQPFIIQVQAPKLAEEQPDMKKNL